MAYYNIHFSPTGGTRKVGDIVCGALDGDFNEIDLCSNVEQRSLCEEDICLVSIPSYGGRVPATSTERLKMISGNGAKAVLNCVYGNRAWEDTLTELQDTLEGQGFRPSGYNIREDIATAWRQKRQPSIPLIYKNL